MSRAKPVELTFDESTWLEDAARRGAADTVIPGAATALLLLANKLAAARRATDSDGCPS